MSEETEGNEANGPVSLVEANPPLPSFPPQKIPGANHNLHKRRNRRRQSDFKQRGIREPAHQIRNRDPHPNGADNPLNHHKRGSAAAIKIADKTKQEGHNERINGISL